MPPSGNELEEFWSSLQRRYRGANLNAFLHTLVPVYVPISTINKTVERVSSNNFAATFDVELEEEWRMFMKPGCTGKIVPKAFIDDAGHWKELGKGRIVLVDSSKNQASAEFYVGSGNKGDTERAVREVSEGDYMEIDRYGAAAKILSSLVEHALAEKAKGEGFDVRRVPEDVARHIGAYYRYDFEFIKDGESKRVEVKSLWGTDTRYARLIASLTKDRKTSSPRFASQDIFAVSRFLQTGDIRDFAFAVSVPESDSEHGLPVAPKHPEHVHQNPKCSIDNKVWFDSVSAVWEVSRSLEADDRD